MGIEAQTKLLEASTLLLCGGVGAIAIVELDLLLSTDRLQWLKGVVLDADEEVDEVDHLQSHDEPVVVVKLPSVEVVLEPLPAPPTVTSSVPR